MPHDDNVALKKRFKVPIFDADVTVLVCKDLEKEWPNYQDTYGEAFPGRVEGLSASNNGHFLIHLRSDKVTATVLAHEVHHLTRQILEWCEVEEKRHHEAAAHLCGYLTSRLTHWLREL